MGRKNNIKMKQGREPLPEGELKKQIWVYVKQADIEALGGKAAAQKLIKNFLYEVLAAKNKHHAD